MAGYFVANLSSSSGRLDDTMQSASAPGVDQPATFADPATPGLAAIFPAGADAMSRVTVETDRASIENSGIDYALVTVEVRDVQGRPVPDGTGII
jgi:hypothetical protein